MKKWILVIVIVIIGILGYNYIYQDHRNIGEEEPEYIVTAAGINAEFISNVEASEKKYLNKTIEVSGSVSESNANDITLNSKLFCQLTDTLDAIVRENAKIKIKGRVIGYDELLGQIKLDQCIITKQ